MIVARPITGALTAVKAVHHVPAQLPPSPHNVMIILDNAGTIRTNVPMTMAKQK